METIIQQRSFNGDTPRIVNPNESHMACLLLLDTSGSMAMETNSGTRPIDELVKALNRFKIEVCEDPATRDILDVAIVEFNTNVRVVQDFVPIEYMQPVALEAQGGTDMAGGLRTAIDMVVERGRFYRRLGKQPYCPWIVMITDGYPSGPIDNIAEELLMLDREDKLRLWSLAVEGANVNDLLKLGHKKRVLILKDHNFTSFFNWVNKSMRSISASSPGERPKGQNLPDNVDLVKVKEIDDNLM